MNAKSLKKKLVLNKTTVSDLNRKEMKSAKGGDDTIYPCVYSAPQIICMTEPPGYTCGTCYNTCNGCGGTGGGGSVEITCPCIDG